MITSKPFYKAACDMCGALNDPEGLWWDCEDGAWESAACDDWRHVVNPTQAGDGRPILVCGKCAMSFEGDER